MKKTESIRIEIESKRYVASVAKKENRTIQGQLSVIIAEWQAMRAKCVNYNNNVVHTQKNNKP